MKSKQMGWETHQKRYPTCGLPMFPTKQECNQCVAEFEAGTQPLGVPIQANDHKMSCLKPLGKRSPTPPPHCMLPQIPFSQTFIMVSSRKLPPGKLAITYFSQLCHPQPARSRSRGSARSPSEAKKFGARSQGRSSE